MENIKFFDSELKVMDIIWEHEPVSAKQIGDFAKDSFGWNKNTTYTVIKKLIEKNAVLRSEPNFICTSLIKKECVAKSETQNLINKLFGGSKKAFFSAFIDDHIADEEIEELKKLIEKR